MHSTARVFPIIGNTRGIISETFALYNIVDLARTMLEKATPAITDGRES